MKKLTSSGIAAAIAAINAQTTGVKVNNAKTAAVAQDHFWISVDKQPPPLGVKLLLINKNFGVACLGIFVAAHGWTHWQGLPKFNLQ